MDSIGFEERSASLFFNFWILNVDIFGITRSERVNLYVDCTTRKVGLDGYVQTICLLLTYFDCCNRKKVFSMRVQT